MERFRNFLLVAAGGAIGSSLRYATALLAQMKGWTEFPVATLIVNVVGCFFITFVTGVVASSSSLRVFLTTGVIGGLTTYSTFDFETTRLLQEGATWTAVANVVVTLVVCFLSGLAGLALARAVAPA